MPYDQNDGCDNWQSQLRFASFGAHVYNPLLNGGNVFLDSSESDGMSTR